VTDAALAAVSTTVAVVLGAAMLTVEAPKRAVVRLRARYRRR